MRPISLILATLLLLACDDAPSKIPPQAAALQPTLALRPGIWTSKAELTPLPLKGAAWIRLLREADQPAVSPNVADQTERTNVRVAAKALVYARTGIQRYRQEVIAACKAVIGTQAALMRRSRTGQGERVDVSMLDCQVALLENLCDTMQHGSMCAMGGMTPYPVRSALNHYPQDFGIESTTAATAA